MYINVGVINIIWSSAWQILIQQGTLRTLSVTKEPMSFYHHRAWRDKAERSKSEGLKTGKTS